MTENRVEDYLAHCMIEEVQHNVHFLFGHGLIAR